MASVRDESEENSGEGMPSSQEDESFQKIIDRLLKIINEKQIRLDELIQRDNSLETLGGDVDITAKNSLYARFLMGNMEHSLDEDLPCNYEEGLLNAITELRASNKEAKEAIGFIENKIKETDEELKDLDKNIDTLKQKIDLLGTQGEVKIPKDISAIAQNVDKMFEAEKRDLQNIIQKMFPNEPSAQELLSELSSAYFNSDEHFITITDDQQRYVELFLRAGIAVRHFSDKDKIKLFPFIE